MMIGLMGILKAGGAYLPIGPENPPDRIRYLLQDAGIRVLLVQQKYSQLVSFDGKTVDLYVLKNANGVTVKIMTLGAAFTEILVPDRTGKMADVNLGFEDVKGFQSKGNPYFGCIVGRVGHRIAFPPAREIPQRKVDITLHDRVHPRQVDARRQWQRQGEYLGAADDA